METKAKKLLPEIRLVKDKSLLTITAIKKKHVDQMQLVRLDQLEAGFGGEVLGWYTTANFDYVVIKKFDDYYRCDIFLLASEYAHKKFPELYEHRPELKQKERMLRHKEQQKVYNKEVEILKRKCTQLFVE